MRHEERLLHELKALLVGVDQKLGHVLCNQERIMSAISDYATKVKTDFATIRTELGVLATKLQTLDDKIDQLQNTPGPISPADQALLDEAQTLSSGLAADVTALAERTEPPAPPTP